MSENFRETFKPVLLAVLVVLFLPLVLVCCILVGYVLPDPATGHGMVFLTVS